MKIEVVSAAQAKAAVKASKLTPEQEKAITEMLENLTKDEGVKIQLDVGEKASAVKTKIAAVAESLGVKIVIKSIPKKNLILVWRE